MPISGPLLRKQMAFRDPDFEGLVIPVWQILINEFILSYPTLVGWMSTLGAVISCFVYPTCALFRLTKSGVVRYGLWPLLHVAALLGHSFLSPVANAYVNVLYQALCVFMTWGDLFSLIFRSSVRSAAVKWGSAAALFASVPLFAFTLVPFQPSVLYALQYSYPLMQAKYALGLDFYRAAFAPGAGTTQYINLILGGVLMPVSNHTWIVALLAFLRSLLWRTPRACKTISVKGVAETTEATEAETKQAGETVEGTTESAAEEPVQDAIPEPVQDATQD